VNLFEQSADNQVQAIQDEIAALSGRIEELTARLADIEQKLGKTGIAAVSVEALENQRQGLQKALAEVQRGRKLAEQRFVVLQEAEAAARTKGSNKTVSAIEVCAGEVRWRNGLLEQLWHINYLAPTGAVEKTIEEWQLVPVSEEPAIAGHIRRRSRQPV
jgi:TolA-binding protein